MTKTIKKDNIIALNLLSLASSEWIVGNVFFNDDVVMMIGLKEDDDTL
jgi:hypothetical protein